jgi:thioredoxin
MAMTTDHFTADVLESATPVLVDFTAAWCAPCRVMEPVLAALEADRDDLRVVRVDLDESLELAAQYGVLSAPTFMLFHHGQPLLTLVGARPRHRLEAELDAVLSPAAPAAR